MKKIDKSKILSHLNKDEKEFKHQIKEDQKLKKAIGVVKKKKK
jgi:hypothetical protein